jgi:hypothetical protein
VGLIGLLGLAFASTFTTLSLGLAILTLLLLLVLLLLLIRPLLVAPVRVTALALHCTDFIGVVLIRAVADRICLKLCDNSVAHFHQAQVRHLIVASDDRDEHLPFLWECSKGDHCLELMGNLYICSGHPGKSHKHLVEINIWIGSERNPSIQTVLEVFKDCRSRCFAIRGMESVPEQIGGEEGGVVLLNCGRQPKHDLPNDHPIILVPSVATHYFIKAVRTMRSLGWR